MTRTTMPRPLPGLVGALAALLAGTLGAQSGVDIDLQDGLLTLRADDTPAERLAEALGEATGISFVVTGEGSTPLSADIVDEPLDKAISLIAPNHMLVREDAAPDAAIIEVVMMMPDPGDSGSASTEFLPSGNPADDQFIEEQSFNAEPGGPQGPDYDENGLPIDPAELRDPGRADAARLQADFQAQGFDENGMPLDGSDGGFDPDPEIDPATGEILQR